jgi:hypothetical protein
MVGSPRGAYMLKETVVILRCPARLKAFVSPDTN